MTPDEALDQLVKASTRNHVVTWGRTGPSQGDPGGDPIIKSACAAVQHKYHQILGYEEGKCNCPAKRHNEVVKQMEEILRKAITP